MFEETEFAPKIFNPKEIGILFQNVERNSKLLEDMSQKQTNEFNVELILDNKIKFNSSNAEQKIQQLPIEKEMIKLKIPIKKFGWTNLNISNEKKFFDDFCFKIDDVLKKLEYKGYPILPSTKVYIYNIFDNYSLIDDNNCLVNLSTLPQNNLIKLKLENLLNKELISDPFSNLKQNFLPENTTTIKKEKKSRKRKISEIIRLVHKFRFLNKGFINSDGKFIKYNSEEASKIMNEPVKTLNNYIKQIKLGKETNFDFNKNKNMEISFLRKHNRHNNKRMK